MKITFVTDTYAPQPNGVATTLHHLVKGLRKQGHEVDVIRPGNIESNEEGMKVPSLALPGYSEIRVGLPMRSKLVSLWAKEPPDITDWNLLLQGLKSTD